LLDAAQKAITSGKHHMRYNRRDVAREQLEQALSILEDLSEQAGIADATFELGILSALQADYGLAQRHYQQALAMWQELDDHGRQAQVLVQLGHVFYCLGDSTQAQEYYAKAQDLVD
jgi:tetratricopeptide (TPR) repeat protein